MPPKGPRKQAGHTGWRQNAERATEFEVVVASKLLALLLLKWSFGFISATQVQEYCFAAVQDGLKHPDVVKVSGIGNSGKCQQNCHRDLQALLSTSTLHSAKKYFNLPWKVSECMTTVVNQAIILPHLLFNLMYKCHPESFRKRLFGDKVGNISKFWNDMRSHPAYDGHPIKKRRDRDMIIPLAMHGDGVPVKGIGKSWGQKVEIYSWSSVLAEGSTIFTHFLIFLQFCSFATGDTYDEIFTIIAWSLACLWTGEFPTMDWRGVPYVRGQPEYLMRGEKLAGGFCACLWVMRGDLEYLCQRLGLRGFRTLQPCFYCLADCCDDSVHGKPWSHFSPKANSLQSIWTNAEWKDHYRDGMNVLFNLPGVGILTVFVDFMHTKHIGTDAYFYGSVLAYMVFHMMDDTPERNMDVLWAKIKSLFEKKNPKSYFQRITLNMFVRDGTFPSLKGRASEVKHLGPALLETFHEMCDVNNDRHRQIRLGLQKSVEIEEIMEENKHAYKLPEEAGKRFRASIFEFLATVTWLRSDFGGEALFHVTIKFHYLMHLGLMGIHLNPRLGWCYAGEDYMQLIGRIVKSCQSGSPTRIVANKSVAKYLTGMEYLFSDLRFKS